MEKHAQVPNPENPSSKAKLWDCGSTLYDSFELNSFKRQLDSAIANSSRTLSMPHLPDRPIPLQPPPPSTLPAVSIKPLKISRALHKFLRSVFKPGKNSSSISRSSSSSSSSSSPVFEVAQKSKDRYYVVYDKSGPVLSTIPEVPEYEVTTVSPEISSLVRRSASERFTPSIIDFSCA